jgi:hypothetical protein
MDNDNLMTIRYLVFRLNPSTIVASFRMVHLARQKKMGMT